MARHSSAYLRGFTSGRSSLAIGHAIGSSPGHGSKNALMHRSGAQNVDITGRSKIGVPLLLMFLCNGEITGRVLLAVQRSLQHQLRGYPRGAAVRIRNTDECGRPLARDHLEWLRPLLRSGAGTQGV
jgi:hypothetical protein